jgi:transposase
MHIRIFMLYRHIGRQVKEITLDLILQKYPIEDIVELLLVSVRSIFQWRKYRDVFGEVTPPPSVPRGRMRIIPPEILDALHILLEAEPSAYLSKMQTWLTVEHDIAISIPALQRNLTMYGLTHKKLTTLAKERNEAKQAQWMEFVCQNFYDFQIICTDESYKDVRTHSR